jgi:four helix bundle protein
MTAEDGEERREERAPAQSFEDLVAWQKAHEFVLGVYALTKTFPNHELFGLTSQLRRAAVSVPANIAEGFKKRGERDKMRLLNIAQGSLEECRYYLILCRDLGYADPAPLVAQLGEVSRLLAAYLSAIRASAR